MELHSLHRSLTWGLAITLLSVAGWSIPAIADDELTPIFDGKTLDGWHAIPEDSVGDWSVQDGVIVAQGSVDQLAYPGGSHTCDSQSHPPSGMK